MLLLPEYGEPKPGTLEHYSPPKCDIQLKHEELGEVNEVWSVVKSAQNPGGKGEHDMFKELTEVTVAGLWSVCEGRGESWKRDRLKEKSLS